MSNGGCSFEDFEGRFSEGMSTARSLSPSRSSVAYRINESRVERTGGRNADMCADSTVGGKGKSVF